MRTLRLLCLLFIGFFGSHSASAQCPTGFIDSVMNGGLVYLHSTSTVSGLNYAWYLDGHLTVNANPNTSAYFQGVSNGTHNICLYVYDNGALCDTQCHTVTVTGSTICPVASFTDSIHNYSIVTHSTSTGTDTATRYVWHVYYGTTGTLLQNVVGGENFTSNSYNSGIYRVCLLLYRGSSLNFCDSTCQIVTIPNANPCGNLVANLSINSSSTNGTVILTSTSTGVPSGSLYQWANDANFSTPSATNNPYTLTNLTQGHHQFCLYVYANANTFCDSACLNEYVTNTGSSCVGLSASWTQSYHSNGLVNFTSADTVSGTTHYWSFGDGTTSTSANPSHGYANGGLFHVCQYVSIPGTTCHDSSCANIQANPYQATCSATFRDSIYANANNVVGFVSTSTATDSITSYAWSFGDNTTGTGIHPDHAYANSGTYYVCLYITTSAGCSSTHCDSVHVNTTTNPCAGVSAAWTSSQGTGVNDSVEFHMAAGNPSNIHSYWTFGDGTATVAGLSVTHHFAQNGTYTVCHYVYIPNTNCVDSSCHAVAVTNHPICGVASFSMYAYGDTSIHALSTSTGVDSTVSYTWYVSDANNTVVQTSTGHANYFYSHGLANGTYNVCLYIFRNNTAFCDSECHSITINHTTNPCGTLTSVWTASYLTNGGVHFVGNGNTTTVSNYWVFGDGTVSTLVDPTHYYNAGGLYTVCHYVYIPGTACRDSFCHSVQANASTGCNASFASQVSATSLATSFASTSTSSDSIISYAWTFGDNTTGTGHYNTHTYNHAGTYRVCLVITTAGGCTSDHCDSVHVGTVVTGCHGAYTYVLGSTGTQAYFTSTSTAADSIVSTIWFFGDNTSSGSGIHVGHTYANAGNYYACVKITTASGCISYGCDTVRVHASPCANLTATWAATYTSNGGVHFAGSNGTNTTIHNLWVFGDGSTSTNNDPTHYYAQGGLYTVCHIVNIPGTVCADTSCSSVQGSGTGGTCHANFTAATTSTSTTVVFTNTSTSTDSIISSVWTFGDGSTSHDPSVHHAYNALGAYQVCLTITSANGCTSTTCDSVHIGQNTNTCNAAFTYSFDSCNTVHFVNTSTGSMQSLSWSFGDGTSSTLNDPHHVYAQAGTYTVVLTFNGTGGCVEHHTALVVVQPCTTNNTYVCGVVFEDLNGNGVKDANEPGIANAEVHIGNYAVLTDSTGHYVKILPSGTYSIYYCAPAGNTFTIPVNTTTNSNTNVCGAYQNVSISHGGNCGFNFGIQSNSVTICGLVYFDANNNGSFDANSEAGIANAEIHITGGNPSHTYTVITDQYGHYCAVVPVGTYTITVSSGVYHNGTITPQVITVSATTGGHSFSNNNFGIYTQPAGCDLSVNITPHTNVAPGYPAWYDVQVCNIGAGVTSGTVNMFYDPALHYNYSSPSATSQNSSTYTISWTVTNLAAGACQSYFVSLGADSILPLGQFIFTLANANTSSCNDVNLNNNVDTVHQEVTGSWDPNNKSVSPAGSGPQGTINGTEELTYTINFQNTGNAPAVNIVIHDDLSVHLDLSTFRMISASHPYTMQFNANEAIWKFNAIMLPDSGTSQEESHGYVSFAIKPLTGLAPRTQIFNSAEIFFDYNEGVTTNSTLNTINYTLGIDDLANGNVTITLMPNPFTDFTTVKIDGDQSAYQLIVYDMVGNIVRNQTAENNTFSIERGSLASGMYLYNVLQNGKVIGKGKMIAQ